MNKQNVTLTLIGKQLSPEGEEIETKTIHSATFHERGDSMYLFFEETDEETKSTTQSSLKIKGQVVELTRKGATTTRMLFEAGQTHRTSYQTMYGAIFLDIQTLALSLQMSEDTWSLHLLYDLYTDNTLLSHNQMQISIHT